MTDKSKKEDELNTKDYAQIKDFEGKEFDKKVLVSIRQAPH